MFTNFLKILRVVSLTGDTYNDDSGLVWQYGMTSEDDKGTLTITLSGSKVQ